MENMQSMHVQSIHINYRRVEVYRLSLVCFGHLSMTTVSKAMAWSMIMLTVAVCIQCVCVCVVLLHSMPDRMDESGGTLLVIAG